MCSGTPGLSRKELRGRMKKYTERLYKSKAWQRCRNEYAKSVGHLCECCLKNGIYKAGEIVHHKEHITKENINDINVTLNWDNLELLCRDCHGRRHGRTKRYKVDECGRVSIKHSPLS